MSELDAYDYPLPPELIAQQPLANRADARLLVVDRAAGSLSHWHIRDLPELLRKGDCLVVNDTRVLRARLVGRRASTGGRWEGLFLSADTAGDWQLLCKTRGRLAPGDEIQLFDPEHREIATLRLLMRHEDGSWIARPRPAGPAFELLENIGRVPLPHYIREGQMLDVDIDRYQTVYADKPGAVAAPTAGLHLTTELLGQMAQTGVTLAKLTLHVGLGTFRPIQSETLAAHSMHSETGCIDQAAVETISQARAAGGRIVAVGTTTVRLLETAAQSGSLTSWSGATDLFIRPPFEFRAVDALLTNFHLPRTTLLVLVCTFGGQGLIMDAYREAIREEYRFYSYGDAMLVV